MADHRSDPRFFHVASDREGFFIEDDFGEEVTHWPGWDTPQWREQSHQSAIETLNGMVADYLASGEAEAA